jgi:transposase
LCDPRHNKLIGAGNKSDDEDAEFRAASLLEVQDALSQLRKRAKQQVMAQVRRHADYSVLATLPGFGPVRVAQLIAIVGTPHRFRTKRQFWPYCGYAVVTQSSADYQVVNDKIVKQQKKVSTHGLNRNPQLNRFSKAHLSQLYDRTGPSLRTRS